MVLSDGANQVVTGEDIAEQIVWVASRPDHVQVAEMRMSLFTPTSLTASDLGSLRLSAWDPMLMTQSCSLLPKPRRQSITKGHKHSKSCHTECTHGTGSAAYAYHFNDPKMYLDRVETAATLQSGARS